MLEGIAFKGEWLFQVGVEIRLGGLNVEGKGEEIAKNESYVRLAYLNGQKCHSLE